MIAEATIREALTEPPPAGSLFEACVEAVGFCKADSRDGFTDENCAIIARAVIQAIIDRTGSPYTVDELTRILSGGV